MSVAAIMELWDLGDQQLGLGLTPHQCRHALATLMFAVRRGDFAHVAAVLAKTEQVARRHYGKDSGEAAAIAVREALLAYHRGSRYRRDHPGAQERQPGPSGDSVPLRLAGALHGLVLDGSTPSLASVYPPLVATDAALWAEVDRALQSREACILSWLERAPQTNEVRRAVAVIAGIWWALGRVGRQPVVLSELGASAGLNLALDPFSVAMDGATHGRADSVVALQPEWRGHDRPAPCAIEVADRRGVDLCPLDASSPSDALRLQAYIWPDQPERMARTRAAMMLVAAPPDAGDAAPWLAQRMATPKPGMLHVVYTTIAAQYFPKATQAAIAKSLSEAGSVATADSPILHLALEADYDAPGAALTGKLWAGGEPRRMCLGRADFHSAWISWSPHPDRSPAEKPPS